MASYFDGCKSLVELPESFGNLPNLKLLNLTSCQLIQKLPTRFSYLKKLKELFLEETVIMELPIDFGKLQSLGKAYFDGCKSLVSRVA